MPASSIDIWHDRAALHFLTEAQDVGRYVDVATNAITPPGDAVIGGFALSLTAYSVSAYLPLAVAYKGATVTASSTKMAVLGDATRRRILELLAETPASVAEITDQLPVSRPAVSQHLKVLSDAGLVVHRAEGTRHLYQADPDGLAELRKYLDSLWESALGQFQADAQRAGASRRTPKRKAK